MSFRNWRRGLFRLWLLVTVGWIVSVLFFVSITGEFGKKWKEYRRAQAYEGIILRIENGIQSGGLTDNQGKFVDSTELQLDLDGVKSRQPQINEQSELATKWLQGLLRFLLVPTLSLLILGRAGIWVVEGFRVGNQKEPK